MKDNKMESKNYKFHPSTFLPHVTLKDGHSGVINEVSFYPNEDYIRGTFNEDGLRRFSYSLQSLLNKNRSSLELCDDADLAQIVFKAKWLSKHKIEIPLQELYELRDLEKRLRKEKGEYRSKR